MWVCKHIKYLHIFYAVWKSLQHLNFTIRLDVFNEVQLTFERFRLSNRAAGKDERHKVVYFLLPVIIKKRAYQTVLNFTEVIQEAGVDPATMLTEKKDLCFDTTF